MAYGSVSPSVLREQFPPALYAAVYPLLEHVEVHEGRDDPSSTRATVSSEHQVEMGATWSSCTCPSSVGRQWMCRHKLAVLLQYRVNTGALSAEQTDDEHLRALALIRLDTPSSAVDRYLDTRTREELSRISISSSYEYSDIGWPLRAQVARWALDGLAYADHLYAGVEHTLDADQARVPMRQVPEQLKTVIAVLWDGLEHDNPLQLLPSAMLLLFRMREVIEASMPVSSEVRRFYGWCMDLVYELRSRGAVTWDECAELILDLELGDRTPEALCPSLQWATPAKGIADALRNQLDAHAEEIFEELVEYSDIHAEVDPDLCRRWNRILRVMAETAFAVDDLEELGRVLARWGEAPYGEFARRGSNTRAASELLPITLAAKRAGRITQTSWLRQIRTSEAVLDRDASTTGMRGGVPDSSHRTSPLREVSHSVLVGGLLGAGRAEEAIDVLKQEFTRRPVPEAIPALQTWWQRIGTGEDVVAWSREVMLGS